MKTNISILHSAILGLSVLSLGAATASAAITFDLRAAAVNNDGSFGGGGKTVALNPVGTTSVTLQVWAQVSSAAPSVNPYGVQVILGSIKSTTVAGPATGALAASSPAAPFNNQNTVGALAELSSPVDTVADLGSNLTAVSPNFIKFRKDATAGGQQVGAVFFATGGSPNGATNNAITNGHEFLMGTVTLSITAFSPASVLNMNWVIPAFATPANRGQIAQWTDGDNVVNTGSTQFAEMFVGAPIVITAVPEPSAFGMVLVGALGLVGFRRLGFRRTA
jgi:hypothetical protein